MNAQSHHEIWDPAHVRSLLRLLRSPFHWVQQEPWHSWIVEHGGLKAVYAYLRTCPLTPNQVALLNAILEHPNAFAQAYADQLNISISTYFLHLRQLVLALADCLNAWEIDQPEQAAPPASAPPATQPADPRDLAHLPAPLTSLVGAEEAVAAVRGRLESPAVRLLTLTGLGGIGKTRLAVCVATELLHAFPDGVYFVALDSLHDPALIPMQINKVLGLSERKGPPLDILQQWLLHKQLLLVLDSFEHLIAAKSLISALLAAAPTLKLLVTSRVPLKLYGEYEYQVLPLALPSCELVAASRQLVEAPAVSLFIERAQAMNRTFALTEENLVAIARICTYLAGIPLAIELAAARSKLISPAAMVPYLRQSLPLLSAGPRDLPERHQTLHNTIEWSYKLLTAEEQRLFRCLGLFSGSLTLRAVEQICLPEEAGAPHAHQPEHDFALIDRLGALLDASLIVKKEEDSFGNVRFAMLDFIREYARDRLRECGEEELLQGRYAAYYLALVEEGDLKLSGHEQRAWLAYLEQEHDNIRNVLNWAFSHQEVEIVLRLSGSMWRFWQRRSYLSEGRHWMERAAELGNAHSPQHPALIKVLWGAGWFAFMYNDWRPSERYFEQGLALAQEQSDRHSIGLILHGLGRIIQYRGDYQRARQCFETSLSIFRELGDLEETAWALDHLAALAIVQEQFQGAQPLLEESLVLFQQVGHRAATGQSLHRLGLVAFRQGDVTNGLALLEASLRLSREMGVTWITAGSLTTLAKIVLEQGQREQAQSLLKEALLLHNEVSSREGTATTLEALGAVAAAYGNYLSAARLCGAAHSLYEALEHETYASVPHDQPWQQQLLADITSHLDPQSFRAAWDLGASWSIEQMIHYALAQNLRLVSKQAGAA
jgi:predicted ATPase